LVDLRKSEIRGIDTTKARGRHAMRIRLATLIFAFGLAGGLVSCTTDTELKSQSPLSNCERAYITDFTRQGGHKAVATTGGRALGVHPTGCGFAARHSSVEAAREAALMECRKQEGPRNPGKCKVIESK
jgi:hypothetical protein